MVIPNELTRSTEVFNLAFMSSTDKETLGVLGVWGLLPDFFADSGACGEKQD